MFIISTSDASPTILAQADMKITYSSTLQGGKAMAFTGDDAIGLFKNGTLIDLFGNPASTTFSVAGYSTRYESHLVRKSTVTGPTTDWATFKLEHQNLLMGRL